MKRVRGKLHGENILLNIDGEFKKSVFYATDLMSRWEIHEKLKNFCHLDSSTS
jgi:hypothetical protein